MPAKSQFHLYLSITLGELAVGREWAETGDQLGGYYRNWDQKRWEAWARYSDDSHGKVLDLVLGAAAEISLPFSPVPSFLHDQFCPWEIQTGPWGRWAQRLGLRKVGFQAAMGVNSGEEKNLEAEMEPGYNRTKRRGCSGPVWLLSGCCSRGWGTQNCQHLLIIFL